MIEKQLPADVLPEPKQLEKAYELTLRLRSQLIAVRYDMEQFGMAAATPTNKDRALISQTDKKWLC